MPQTCGTYQVSSLLLLVALLVSRSLSLVRSALLLRESLPLLTEHLADLTCEALARAAHNL
jgi:hypothetical protein